MSAHAAPIRRSGGPLTDTAVGVVEQCWLSVVIAAVLAAICFGATGGIVSLDASSPSGSGLGPNTVVEMALTLGGGVLVALAFARERDRRIRVFGSAAAIALFALAAFSALSVDWSVSPANSWLEANRTFAYAAAFAGALALVRLVGDRWRSVIAGVLLATVVVGAYAVGSKIAPGSLDPSDTMARLRVPFGYWNAVGLIGALGLAPALWLGSRREGHGVINSLAAPAICLLLVTLVLSYSRGAVLASVVGVAVWFVVVPLRLRALAMLAIGAVTAGGVLAWTFAQPALADDNVALAARSAAGQRLGLVMGAALVVAFAAALVVRFAGDRAPLAPARRRALAIAAFAALALVPVAGVAAAAHSSRGLFGTISHGWEELTTPNAQQPSNSASRFASTGSMQALYWSYALDVFDAHPLAGAGAGAYGVASQRYMAGPAKALNAHGYVFQTLADLGLVGLALSLAVVVGWGLAALRTLAPFRARAPGSDAAERLGLATMAVVVVTFVVHSAVDWVYFIPGEAAIALLCAGWVAGRGPWREALEPGRASAARLARSPLAAAGAAAAIAIALVVAWSQWQPLRSEQAATAGSIAVGNADVELAAGQRAAARRQLVIARRDEAAAIARDPLDITPLVDLAGAYNAAGRRALAQLTLERAVALQPSNAASWFNLWLLDSSIPRYEKLANQALAAAYQLDPYDPDLDQTTVATASG